LILGMLGLAALFSPFFIPHDPFGTDLLNRLKPPSLLYPLGTDHLGRCVFSRLFLGARYTLCAGLIASLGALILGASAGLTAGLARPGARGVMNLLMDVVLAFPGLVLALALTGVMGPSLFSLALAMAGAGWAWWGRFVRGLTLTAREKPYVKGGLVCGVRGMRLLRYYIAPQVFSPTLVAASFKTGWMILGISGLSYLGLGAQPPIPEWGAMLQESRLYLTRAPWLMLAPGGMITLTVLGFNFLAEGLRDALEVRQAGEL
jgi:ABC-type dipeptide/oligopeptide/nickel transport system permease subunit